MNKIIAISFTLWLLASCKEVESNRINYSLIETSDTLSFPLEKGANHFIKSMFVYTDAKEKEYLTFRDSHYEPRIFVYDIKSPSKQPKVIHFDKEGPDGTGAVSVGYFISSWDEIYIPNMSVPEISVIDSTGTKKETITLDNEFSSNLTYFSSTSINPFVKYKNRLYGEQQANIRLDSENHSENSVEVIEDLNERSHKLSSFTFPQELLYSGESGKTGILTHAFKCSNNNLLIYSFAYDEKIYVYDMDKDKVIETVDARSKFIEDPSVLSYAFRFGHASYTDFKDICTEACYGNIMYDSFRHLYYRIVYPETTVDDQENFTDLYQSGRSLASIMVLDENFNVLCESLLPENRFRSNLLFINKDGLWISCNHYKNPGYDEDHLQFVRFELKSEN